MRSLLKKPEVIGTIIAAVLGGLFLLIGNYQEHKLEKGESNEGVINIGDGNVIQGDNNIINPSSPQIQAQNLLGTWESNEVWTPNAIAQLFGSTKIKSEIEFQSLGKFLAKSNLTLADIDYLYAEYKGTWSIEDKSILFKVTKVDTFINKFGNQGLQAYNGIKIMQQYLNHEERFKIEKIESFSSKVLQTTWSKNGVEIKKEYIKSE